MSIYLKPVHFIESPQQYAGKSERLAGSLIWFARLEIIHREGAIIKREIIALEDWDNYVGQLSVTDAARLQSQYMNIISPKNTLELGSDESPKTLRFDQPIVMGILNVTPDSFSDGGEYSSDIEKAVEAGFSMASAGATIIDIGGESTRPGAKIIWEGDEAERILPSVKRLAEYMVVSVDTRKALVMEQGLSAGADIINDISALGYDKRSIEVVRDNQVPIIVMHAPSQGDNPHDNADYDDVLFDVYDWLENRVNEIEASGISREKIMVDPGIGFGKNLNENLHIINNLSIFHAIGCPIVFGASRKRLIGALSKEESADKRLSGSLYLAMKAVEQGVHIVRVHDVVETVQALRVWRGLRDAALTSPA